MLIVLFNPQKIRLLNACSMAIIVSFLLCAEVTHAFDGTGYSFTTSAFADCVIEAVEPGAEVSTCCTPTPYILVNSTNSALSGDSQQTSCSNVDPDCYFDFYFADNSIVNNDGYDLVYFEGYNQAAFQISVRNTASGEWTNYENVPENSFEQITCSGSYPNSCGPWSPNYGPAWPQYYRGLLLAYKIDLGSLFSLPAGTRIDAVRYRSDYGGDPVMIGALNNQDEEIAGGDVNGDGKIDLLDAISALNAISNAQSVCAFKEADININEAIGFEEAIYALQVSAGLKSQPICGNGIVDFGEECDDGNLEDGDACTSNCTIIYRTAFLTSSTYTGNLGGVAGADTLCNQLASTASLSGTYKAWISDDTNSPSNRFTRHGQFVLVDETPVANSWSDLTDASIINPINQDESGNTVSSSEYVWSNTDWNGSLYEFASSCLNWTSGSTEERGSGGYILSDYRWSRGGFTAPCDQSQHLYCFEQ